MQKPKENLSKRIDKPKGLVVAIDGPAGAGKSTIAKEVARRLGFTYLDTGAMYRAITLKVIQNNLDLNDRDGLVSLAQNTNIDIKPTEDYSLNVFLDGQDVTAQIRKPEITQNVSFIANVPKLRSIMVKLQRKFGKDNNIVVEGRDITTVVFPKAFKKFYLDADFTQRTKRRAKDFRDIGQTLSDEEVGTDLRSRDKADMTREVGALKRAKDAIYIDSTNLSIEQVVDKIIKIIRNNG